MYTRAWSVVAYLVCAAAVRAATNTWDGGGTDNNWSTGNNWNPNGSVPVSASDTVVQFDGNTRTTPSQNIATPFLLNKLVFLGGATYTAAINVGGTQLQFVTNGVTQPCVCLQRNQSCRINNPIDIPAGTTLFAEIGTYGITLSGAITGGGAIDKQDQMGELTLSSGANTFSGGLIVRAKNDDWCKVNINASSAMGTGPVSLYGGTLLTSKKYPGGLCFYNTTTHTNSIGLSAVSPIFAAMPNGNNANVTLNSDIDLNTHTLYLRGGGAINGAISEGGANAIIKQDAGMWTLGGASTFTGRLTVANGTLKLGAAGSLLPQVGLAFSCSTGWYSVAHATFDLNGHAQAVSMLSGSTTHAFLTNILTSATAATLVVDQSVDTVFNGRLAGALSFVKTGAGSLALSNYPSATTGNITVSNGTLAVVSGANLGSSTNVAVVEGRLELYVAAAIVDAASLNISDGAKVLLGGGATETVDKLFVNGAQQPRGYYGTTASGATLADDAHFEGADLLYVLNNPPITPTSVTWDAGGTDLRLSTAANWVGDATPAFDGTNRATFATGGLTASVDVAVNLYGITFNRAGAFTLAAGAGVISNGAGGVAASVPTTTARTYAIAEDVVLTDHQTWNMATNLGVATLNVTGAISDGFLPCNVTKTGFGPLGLTGSSTFDGTLTITEGDVNIYNSQALGSTNGNTVINGGTGGRLVLNGGLTLSDPLVLNGEKNNNGTLIVGSGSNVVSGPITCFNQVRIQAYNGPLVIAGGVTADNNGLFVVNAGSTITFKDRPLNLGARTFWSDSGGVSVLAVAGNTWGDTLCAGGGIRCEVPDALPPTTSLQMGVVYSPSSTLNLNGNNQTVGKLFIGTPNPALRVITSPAPATLTVNQSANTVFDGRFTGAVSLLKTGAGSLTLTNAFSTTTGGFTVSNGMLVVARAGTFGPNCTNVVVSGTGTLVLSNSVSIADTATIRIADGGGAKLNLAAGVNETVSHLLLGDTFMRVGTYGSSTSGAGQKDDVHFSGSGVLTVRHEAQGTALVLAPRINTNNWPTPFVTNTIPFAAGFEEQPTGVPVSGATGWKVEDGDASKVINQLYDYTGTRPLNTTHTNVLLLETEGQTLGTLLATNATAGTSHLWVDMLARVIPWEDDPLFETENGPAAALFVNFSGNLVLYAAALNSSCQRVAGYFNLSPGREISPTEWHRITLDLMSNADGSNDFVRVFLDGAVLTNAAARVSPASLETNGTWFCLTRHEANLVPSLGFLGRGMVDDLVVTPDQVFEAVLYGLTVNTGTGSGAYTNGQQVAVAASEPPIGKEFDQWIGATQYLANVTSAATTVTMPPRDITLAATYKVSTYTVSFNPQDGTTPNPASILVTYGSAYGALAATTRTGYSFSGWYTNAACSVAEVTNATIVTMANDHTLYAKWILQTTTTTPVPVPFLWLDQFPDLEHFN